MQLQLSKLQAENSLMQKVIIKANNKHGLKDGWDKDIDGMLL